MHHPRIVVALIFLVTATLGASPVVAAKCPPDAVQVGTVCVDKYEASVWSVPANADALLKKVRKGRATAGDLIAHGAVHLGAAGIGTCDPQPYDDAGFPQSGNWTRPLYALSVAGVLPSACVSWYQAANACRLAGKRLLTNEEWQVAASGTPDRDVDDQDTDCNTGGAVGPTATGSREACVSSWGTYDMVGNLDEWIAEWVPRSTGTCPLWPGDSGDFMCMDGVDSNANEPGALFRGGLWFNGTQAGVFAIGGHVPPSRQVRDFGFRCVR
jgi:formylglycine-generating enzyme required for sulfatase activity